MRKIVIFAVLLFLGVRYGSNFFLSAKFQKYGDKTKAPWTCHVNNFIGHIFIILSDYHKASALFMKTYERCPDTPMAESAEFEIAECLYKMGRVRDSVTAYAAFAEKYPESRRAKIAIKATQVISAP